ncbi:hypothetical protein [Rhodococcus sp. NPDC058514]|uniref:hypothetical protein n=1 Tax=unclassified Rhodococcus (in: high G+C Gram-positive bacteria) TaxID=192944 RepID=UPI003659FE17
MNAAELCVDAERSAVEAIVSSAPTVLWSETDKGVTRVDLGSNATANVVDDEQDGYRVSIFVFDPADTGAAGRLYQWLVASTPWSVALRDEGTAEVVESRAAWSAA